ncbi:hypothetical protein Hanom_Chr03g00219101 [Helianthus anomalus]
MIGSDKLFSDIEILIQNVILDKIDKAFKLVEIEKSEIEKIAVKRRKLFITNLVMKRKTQRLGWVIKGNNIKRKGLKSNIIRKG